MILIWISYVAFIATINLTILQLDGRALVWGVTSFISLCFGVGVTFLLLLYTDLDYWSRIYGIAINNLLSAIITFYIIRSKIKFNSSLLTVHFRYFFKLGIPLLFTAIFGWFLINQGRFFIEYYLDLEQLGVFAMAFTLSSPLMLVSTAINRTWLSIGYKYLKNKEYAEYVQYALALILLMCSGLTNLDTKIAL